jgi:hypothetical protein
MGKISETAILRSIMDYLAARHVLAFRMQSGATVSTYKGKSRMVRYGVPGMADILTFPMLKIRYQCDIFGGKYHEEAFHGPTWIEVKTATGKQSELQKSFQTQVEREHHRYGICRSIEDVEALLK